VWGLPGTFLRPGERLAEAVTRSLQAKAGVRVEAVEQLHVFDDPARDDRGWVLSVAHTALVAHERLAPTAEGRRDVRLAPVDAPGRLRYDHRDITNRAVTHIRARHLNGPDPYGLLGAEFTLRRLQQLHEAVAGASLQRDTFRRNMEPGLLPTGRHTENQRGRPAELFRRRK
jgi:ADP-ribose pyrophosphatase YjhB (NUDIX family)